jgi:Transposase IS4
MLEITTAYSLSERTLRERRRSALTSTNARIVRPVFGDAVKKWLYIPTAIDAYNHHMNGVDRSNQLRRNMTVCRPNEQRIWRPMWLWLLNISLVNSFLIWKEGKEDKRRRGHRLFRQALCQQLLETQDTSTEPIHPPPTTHEPFRHTRVRFSKSNYCVQCKPVKATPGSRKRRFGDNLPANVAGNARKQGSRTFGGCLECGKYLCVKGNCFDSYHSPKE